MAFAHVGQYKAELVVAHGQPEDAVGCRDVDGVVGLCLADVENVLAWFMIFRC